MNIKKTESVRQRKHFTVLITLCLSIILGVLSGCSSTKSSIESTGDTSEYAEKIFGADIISIEIIADDTEWQAMLDNAIEEEYIKVDVVVNGIKFKDVGIRPKGNSSLTQVASTDSDRYSFRLKFDKYVEDQTCFGLESFVVNNMLGDNSYMKEYISYDLMKTIGVESPYFGFSNITVNGKSWGLYLAVELYNDSYEERVFDDTSGMLYNVKMNMSNAGESGIYNKYDGQNKQDANTKSSDSNMNNEMFFKDKGGNMGASNSGGSLQYIDDKSSSYSSIFDNAVGKSEEADYQRVIMALKALSTGTDLEKHFDVDAILKYLAAHTIVVNLDSYSSSMAQNYYIYEKDGKITILPWDYNLAWGGFQSSDAASVINFPIDTPVSGVEMADRPLLEKLFANSKYLEKYHQYMQELIDSYFADGKFEAKVQELNTLISNYVKEDSTAFCTYEEYQKAVKSLTTLGNLRAKSVQGQLEGTVPSTTAEQKVNSDKLISAGDLNIRDLGSMMGGKGGPPQGGLNGGNQFPRGNSLDMDIMQKAMRIIQDASGTISDEVKTKLRELGLNDEEISMFEHMKNMENTNNRPIPGRGNTSKNN
ncbi:CotH kinase family protein [Desulforamulus aquiferis]|uniref:CotH kinase family protein n=1 Tax=Desulforamulus aquiferis TaxID=1397668 RepID=A0AAW7Z8N1_9FIRM|nr:CotH kinase family protein [Desulforamulus aquiferis]MDO7785853.1 CotH kinase family protein [Desulforamulus aquiferis]